MEFMGHLHQGLGTYTIWQETGKDTLLELIIM